MPDSHLELYAAVATIGAITARAVYDTIRGRRLEKRQNGRQQQTEEALRKEMTAGFTRVEKRVERVEAFVVGPDGENGIRGDLRSFKDETMKRLDGLEERERGRLERDVNPYRPPR